jgi:CSLREA domain-containing protein
MSEYCRRRCAHALWEGLAIGMLFMATAQAQNFTVDSTTDAVDAVPGNGICADASKNCTLRAAIQEANALGGCRYHHSACRGVSAHDFQYG